MKFLTNGFKEITAYTVTCLIGESPEEACLIGESPEEAVKREKEYRKDKVIDDPFPTEHYTVAELKKMGMVGIYTENSDC